MPKKPIYVVFAGVNGAGKSTLYQSGLWRTADMPKTLARVNPDELLRAQGGDWREAADQLAAGKAALAALDAAFSQRASLTHENTLTGRTSLRALKTACERGYRIILHYVGVSSAEIALARIAHRVSVGGHDIDPAIVKRRFNASMRNLSLAIPYCEEVFVYDNSFELKCIAGWRRNTLCWWGVSGGIGDWLTNTIRDESTWKR